MPELPDVEIIRRHLARSGLHRGIEHVDHVDEQMLDGITRQALGAALRGHRLGATRRHGKWLFARTDRRSQWLVLHFGMTGRLCIDREQPEPSTHTRLAVHFSDGGCLLYECERRLGTIGLTDSVRSFVTAHELGPDALRLDRDQLAAILGRSRGSVKATLMDQSQLAGMGNVYADEACFHAGLDPRAPVDHLDEHARRRLARSIRAVLRTAIEHGADPNRVPASWLLGHRDEGTTCPRGCGAVARVVVGGRSTYLCPACQGDPGSASPR